MTARAKLSKKSSAVFLAALLMLSQLRELAADLSPDIVLECRASVLVYQRDNGTTLCKPSDTILAFA